MGLTPSKLHHFCCLCKLDPLKWCFVDIWSRINQPQGRDTKKPMSNLEFFNHHCRTVDFQWFLYWKIALGRHSLQNQCLSGITTYEMSVPKFEYICTSTDKLPFNSYIQQSFANVQHYPNTKERNSLLKTIKHSAFLTCPMLSPS